MSKWSKRLVCVLPSVSVFVFIGVSLGGVRLIAPDVDLMEGDRIVEITWTDPQPESLVYLAEPVLGAAQFPWRGKATIEVSGFYIGACDWTYDVTVIQAADSVYFSWMEVSDWRTKAERRRELRVEETDIYYSLSDGIRVAVPSAGLFRLHIGGWQGPVPDFHGIYRGAAPVDTSVLFTLACTSGGTLASQAGGEIGFSWTNSAGESGNFNVANAGQDIEVSKGLRAIFPAGDYAAGETLSVDARVPFGKPDAAHGLTADGFKIRAYTFEGYLVVHRSVEDRSPTPTDTVGMYKVIADLKRCENPGFFADGAGKQDPYGTRYVADRGIRERAPGVTPDSTARVVLNGFPYDYAVVTYDWSSDYKLVTSPIRWTKVYPAVAPGRSIESVYVVPNPYVFRAGWEQGDSKVQFVNVPERAEIEIYDASGGYIGTVRPNHRLDGSQAGTADWNLRDNGGKQVVSGIYIYRVEAEGASRTGRFIVVR
ncbi:MAG: T9SS type A sorting domain-containing protein [Candidatus Eisenbacteria bacterium]